MRERFHFFVSGNEDDLRDFVVMLEKQGIRYSFPEAMKPVLMRSAVGKKKRTRKLEPFEVGKYQILSSITDALISGMLVEITKESLKAILSWLKERRKKGKKPRLVIQVKGDILRLSAKDLKLLATILEKASEKRS